LANLRAILPTTWLKLLNNSLLPTLPHGIMIMNVVRAVTRSLRR
jgi:hypothetical protein